MRLGGWGSWGFGVNPRSGTDPAIQPEAARDAGWPQTPPRDSAYVPSCSVRALASWGRGGWEGFEGVERQTKTEVPSEMAKAIF